MTMSGLHTEYMDAWRSNLRSISGRPFTFPTFNAELIHRVAASTPELTDEHLTLLYMEANGITGKKPAISTQAIFRAMRLAATLGKLQ